MAVVIDGGIIAVIVLVSVLVILILLFILTSLVVVRKKHLLCFKGSDYTRPFHQTDRALHRHRGKHGKAPYNRKKPKKITHKKEGYQSFSKALKFPKRDPFAKSFLENPMIDTDEFNEDWTNPAFDASGAEQYDAALLIQSWYRMLRVRVPFLQLRDSVILAQSLYRRKMVQGMLPQLRREKAQRDNLRKKQAGWKKKGTLAALKYFDVKAFGFAEVEQLYGMETVRDAAYQLKNLYGGKGKMKLKLFISVKGIKLYHIITMEHFATVKISTVSFCTLDPKNRKVFAFINRKKRRNFCHVFQASESDAQKMVETMAEAFEVTFRRLEQQKKEKERERSLRVQRERFDRRSQQLEDEVQSMLEMAETASSVMQQDRLSQASSDTESLTGSRERLLSSPERPSRPARSSLVTASYRAPFLPQDSPLLSQPQPLQGSPRTLPQFQHPQGSPRALPQFQHPQGSPRALPQFQHSRSSPRMLPQVQHPQGSPKALLQHQHRRQQHRRQLQRKEEEQPLKQEEEPFDIEKVDEYFTGIKEGVDIISLSLEKESQQAQVLSQKRNLEQNLDTMVEKFS